MIVNSSSCVFRPLNSLSFGAKLSEFRTLASKVQEAIYPHFQISSSVYFFGMGSIEMFNVLYPSASDQKIKTIRNACLAVHGGLLIGVGVSSALEALHSCGLICLGNLRNLVCFGGNLLFLTANLVALEENIRLYWHISVSDQMDMDKDQSKLFWEKQSIIWGILSNLGYITAAACLLFGGGTALALLIGVISSFFGGLKALHDFITNLQREPFLM